MQCNHPVKQQKRAPIGANLIVHKAQAEVLRCMADLSLAAISDYISYLHASDVSLTSGVSFRRQ